MNRWRGTLSSVPRKWLVAGAVGAVVAIAIGAGISRLVAPSSPSAPSQPGTTPAGTPAGFVPFRAADGSYSISYPPDWFRLRSQDPQIELLATAQETASLSVRTFPLNSEITRANVDAGRQLTERIVESGERVKPLAQPRRIELGGLPGYLYLYTFEDPDSGETGAHSHYFLFQGDKMIVLVFQTVPADELGAFAPVFDRIAASFRGTAP